MTPFDLLTEINIDDFLNAWGLANLKVAQTLLRNLVRPPAQTFAREMLRFDESVGQGALQLGGKVLCQRYTGGVEVAGQNNIPRKGGVLILSNHPGLSDTVALFAAIPRDVHVIALDRPFLRALPHTSQKLFYLPDDPAQRAGVTRNVAHFLKQGGAAITFPAGQIEPDPAVHHGAVESLSAWSESIGLFARLAPNISIVPAIVSGVNTLAAQHNPLTKLRRAKKDQELLGAALQIAWRGYQNNIVRVAFAPPLPASELVKANRELAAITHAITDSARELIEQPPNEWVKII